MFACHDCEKCYRLIAWRHHPRCCHRDPLVEPATAQNQDTQIVTRMQFPDDDNGRVLKEMMDSGDDLSKPRLIEFQHVFTSKEDALAFIGAVSNETDRFELSWFEAKRSWNVQVARYMIPTYRGVTSLELALEAEARKHNGQPDGWGCFNVGSNN